MFVLLACTLLLAKFYLKTLGSAIQVDITLTCFTYKSVAVVFPIWDVLHKQVQSMEVPPLNLQDFKNLLLTSPCQILQHSFRGLVESMPPWFKAVLVGKVRPTHYAGGQNVMDRCLHVQAVSNAFLLNNKDSVRYRLTSYTHPRGHAASE